jgi:hypothetical protein
MTEVAISAASLAYDSHICPNTASPINGRAEERVRRHRAFDAHVEHARAFADEFAGRDGHHRRTPPLSSHVAPPASATVTIPCTISTSAQGTRRIPPRALTCAGLPYCIGGTVPSFSASMRS